MNRNSLRILEPGGRSVITTEAIPNTSAIAVITTSLANDATFVDFAITRAKAFQRVRSYIYLYATLA
jgi:hypothetical protein